jgi:rod shape-determining protein MreD
MIRKLRFAAWAFAMFLLQTALVHRFSFHHLRPQLLHLTAVFLALEARPSGALWGAFALGLLSDLGSSGRPGSGPLLLLPATAALIALRGHLLRDWFWTDMLLALAYLLTVGVAHAAAVWITSPAATAGTMARYAIGPAVLSTALTPLLFPLMARAGIVAQVRGRPGPA